MNSNTIIINDIYNNYYGNPYYYKNGYIAINDDRIGRIEMFKLYEKNNKIYVDFKEISQIEAITNINRNETKIIRSLNDFRNKFMLFISDLH